MKQEEYVEEELEEPEEYINRKKKKRGSIKRSLEESVKKEGKSSEDIKSRKYFVQLKPIKTKGDFPASETIIVPRISRPLEGLGEDDLIVAYLIYMLFNGKPFSELIHLAKHLGYSEREILNRIQKLSSSGLLSLHKGKLGVNISKIGLILKRIPKEKAEETLNKLIELKMKVINIPKVMFNKISLRPIIKQNVIFETIMLEKHILIPRLPEEIGKIRVKVESKGFDKNIRELSVTLPKPAKIPKIPILLTQQIAVKQLTKKMITQEVVMEYSEEYIDPLKELFNCLKYEGKILGEDHFKSLLRVSPDRPVIIVASKDEDDDYLGMLLSILREIYRIKEGGLPYGRYVKTQNNYTKRVIEEEPLRPGFIKVIDNTYDILPDFERHPSEQYERIWERLIEVSLQGFSVLVIYVNNRLAERLLEVLISKSLGSLVEKISPVKVISTLLNKERLNRKQRLFVAGSFWGFLDYGDVKKLKVDASLDSYFKRKEYEFYEKLEEIGQRREYSEMVKESDPDEPEKESALHYLLKIFVVYYFMEKLKVSKDYINTEEPINGKRSDVFIKSDNEGKSIAIEIETFYGTGVSPWSKLERTIEKYNQININVSEILIVIPPLQATLYLKDLLEKSKELREHKKNVKICTVDLSQEEIISIEEFYNKLKEGLKELNES